MLCLKGKSEDIKYSLDRLSSSKNIIDDIYKLTNEQIDKKITKFFLKFNKA